MNFLRWASVQNKTHNKLGRIWSQYSKSPSAAVAQLNFWKQPETGPSTRYLVVGGPDFSLFTGFGPTANFSLSIPVKPHPKNATTTSTTMISITSTELNYLVFRYLHESGFVPSSPIRYDIYVLTTLIRYFIFNSQLQNPSFKRRNKSQ